MGSISSSSVLVAIANITHPRSRRSCSRGSMPDVMKENADVAFHFVADRFKIHRTDSLQRLAPGTGKVIEIDGKKIAAYRDEEGGIHALSPICTHAACIVGWNAEEKSWDCPCHGARYDINGVVLTGPATKGLAAVEMN